MAAFAAAATSEPVDPEGYAPIRTLLLALNPRLGGQSPVHKLKDQPQLFRIVNEYVHRRSLAPSLAHSLNDRPTGLPTDRSD